MNVGGLLLNMQVTGADEALEKLNAINAKLAEAKQLIGELASTPVDVRFKNQNDECQPVNDC